MTAADCPLSGRDREKSGREAAIGFCPSLTDAVEKGKNELTEIFRCVPVETGIS